MRRKESNQTNQQNDLAPSVDSDQTGHPPSLIRVITVLSTDSLGTVLAFTLC